MHSPFDSPLPNKGYFNKVNATYHCIVMMLETMIRMNTSNKKCNMPLTSHFSDYTSHLPPVRKTGNPSKELLLTAVSEAVQVV